MGYFVSAKSGTKCGKSQGVWIFSEGTVKGQRCIQNTQNRVPQKVNHVMIITKQICCPWVCQDDIGGERILQKRWTSFAKAELLCRPPKELPFNIIQDVFTLTPSEGYSTQDIIFYGIFTSQW